MAFDHEVKRGDGIESIAFEHGFFPQTIWDWPENSKLKEEREDMNILAPGDVVHVPDLRVKQETKPAEKRHRFKRKGVPEILAVTLLDHNDEPFAHRPYRFEIDGSLREGTTDSNGVVEEWIPPGSVSAKLLVDELGRTYKFRLGGIDPISLDSGVAQRLHALGYGVDSDEDDFEAEEVRAAIAEFQKDEEIEATGEIDDATRAALKTRFGS